jgi:hypothetical protein
MYASNNRHKPFKGDLVHTVQPKLKSCDICRWTCLNNRRREEPRHSRMTTLSFSLSAGDVLLCTASGCIIIVSMLPPERGMNGKPAGDLINTPSVTASSRRSRIEIRLLSETRSVLEYLQKSSLYIHTYGVEILTVFQELPFLGGKL